MGAELVARVTHAGPTAAPAADAHGTLTRRASLTAAASLLDYAAKAAVGLVLTPILVGGLGRSLFGVWEMLSRLGTYMTATDGRPTEALRLIIAQHQANTDEAVKRRYVGAALAVWLLMLPLVLAVGAVFSWWLAPALTRAAPALTGPVRLTSALIVVMFLASSLAEVPESALRGANLGYRRMGLQASLNVVGGVLAALAVWAGLGLPGLGASQIVRAAATGLCFWLLVRRYVPWFGAERPTRAEVRTVFGMSLWLTVGDAIAKVLTGADVLILGAVLAPAAVTTYALTSYAARTAVGIHIFAAGAAMPGLGGLLGSGEMARAARARHELLVLTWLFAAAVGAAILLWNRAFLGLWVGEQNYAGAWVDLLIVLGTIQTLLIRTDAYVIDAALRPRMRVLIGGAAALVMLVLCVAMTRVFGLIGLVAGTIIGRGLQSVAYPALVRASLGAPAREPGSLARGVRLVVVTTLLFAAAATLGQRLHVAGWLTWAGGVVTSLPLIAALALFLGLGREDRRAVIARLRGMVPWASP